MRVFALRRVPAIATIVVVLSLAGVAVAACNSVLGIDAATLETADAGGVAFSALDECSSYCSDMALSCPQQPNQEYIASQLPDASVCGTICGDLIGHVDEAQLGSQVDLTAAMPTDDSIACRIWHANVAGKQPEDSGARQTHCSHAGPLGGSMCGQDPCEVFCFLAVSICDNNRPGAVAYSSEQDCLDACRADAGGYPGYRYESVETLPDLDRREPAGNTLNCRMYHLENYLATGDPVHCSHVAKDGGGICVDSDE
ncbi:MAG TPA: hypothetical protein VK762_07230 [Polyangiaceae bacterium]|jgi:hypothetical protein|nr:hypothetical protein [Polyangiaceae bacterium]